MGERWTEERDAPVAERLAHVTRLAAEAYEQSRADRAELVRERDEARAAAIRTPRAERAEADRDAHASDAASLRVRLERAVEGATAAQARVTELEAEVARLAEQLPAQVGLAAAAVAEMADLRAQVARLRGVLAEPSDEDVRRMGGMLMQQIMGGVVPTDVVRAIVAYLRARAGGADG